MYKQIIIRNTKPKGLLFIRHVFRYHIVNYVHNENAAFVKYWFVN